MNNIAINAVITKDKFLYQEYKKLLEKGISQLDAWKVMYVRFICRNSVYLKQLEEHDNRPEHTEDSIKVKNLLDDLGLRRFKDALDIVMKIHYPDKKIKAPRNAWES